MALPLPKDREDIVSILSKLPELDKYVFKSSMFEVQEQAYLPGAKLPVVEDDAVRRHFCPCGHGLVMNEDKYGMVCGDCGQEPRDAMVLNREPEHRQFADADAKENQDKIRTSEYTAEADYDRCHFDPREVPNPEWMRIVTNRLNQTMVWLYWLTPNQSQPGHLALTADEAATFKDVLRAACLAWVAARKRDGELAVDDTDDEEVSSTGKDFGSPIFWAITIALGVVARRVGGFCVQTEAQADLFTVEALHSRLFDHKSYTQYTHEKLGNRTQAGGSAAAGAKVIGATTMRKARFDLLGNEVEQTKKRLALNRLILDSKVFGMTGLSSDVMHKLKPRVMVPCVIPGHMVAPVSTECLFKVLNKHVGFEADTSHTKPRLSYSSTRASPPLESPGLTLEEMEADNDEERVIAAAREEEMDAYDAAHQPKPKSTPRSVSQDELGKMSWAQVVCTQNYARKGEHLKRGWKLLHADHLAGVAKAKYAQDHRDRKAQETAVKKRVSALRKEQKVEAKAAKTAKCKANTRTTKDEADEPVKKLTRLG